MNDLTLGRKYGLGATPGGVLTRSMALDVLAVCGVTVLAFGLFHVSEVAQSLLRDLRLNAGERVGEILLTVIPVVLMLAWFAWRRWRDACAERSRRLQSQEELSRSLLRAEMERALRIGRRPAWRFELVGAEGCERNIADVTGAIVSLADLIHREVRGKDPVAAREAETLKEYLLQNLTTSMRETCQQCRQETGQSESASSVVYPAFRRERFLLRLLTAKVAPLFSPGAPGERVIPRRFTVGFDLYLHQVFGESLYMILNREARDILSAIPSDDDGRVWTNLMADRRYRNFGLRLLARLRAAFDDFERGRTHLTTAVANHLRAGVPGEGRSDAFVDADFAAVFSALLGDLFEFVEEDDNRIWLDYICGTGTADAALRTHLEFSLRVVAALPRDNLPEIGLRKIA